MKSSQYVKTKLTPIEIAELYPPTENIGYPILNTIYELQQISRGYVGGVNNVSVYDELNRQGVLNPNWSRFQTMERINDYMDLLLERGDIYITYEKTYVEFGDELIDSDVYEDIRTFLKRRIDKMAETRGVDRTAKYLNVSVPTIQKVRKGLKKLTSDVYWRLSKSLGYQTIEEVTNAVYERDDD